MISALDVHPFDFSLFLRFRNEFVIFNRFESSRKKWLNSLYQDVRSDVYNLVCEHFLSGLFCPFTATECVTLYLSKDWMKSKTKMKAKKMRETPLLYSTLFCAEMYKYSGAHMCECCVCSCSCVWIHSYMTRLPACVSVCVYFHHLTVEEGAFRFRMKLYVTVIATADRLHRWKVDKFVECAYHIASPTRSMVGIWMASMNAEFSKFSRKMNFHWNCLAKIPFWESICHSSVTWW